MKIKELIKLLTINNGSFNSINNGLYGKDLLMIKDNFNNIDEFKKLNINIIQNLNLDEKNYNISYSSNGVTLYDKSDNYLVTVKENTFIFNNNIDLYGIFLLNDDLYFRLSNNSIKEWIN